MKLLLLITGALSLFILGLIVGYINPAVVASKPENELYTRYIHFKMYEDGSYSGQTTAGTDVTGCIDNAICNNE